MKTGYKVIIGSAIVVIIAVAVYFILKNKTAKAGDNSKTKKIYALNPNGINVRKAASTASEIVKADVTGLVGFYNGETTGEDGYTWYAVKEATNKPIGFVRSDVVELK